MTDFIQRAKLPSSFHDLRLFAKSEEQVSYWENQLSLRFGTYGPLSKEYQSAERCLIDAHMKAENWGEAFLLARKWEKSHAGETTWQRAENSLILATSLFKLDKVIECKELLGMLIFSTKKPIFGWWTLYYHICYLTLLSDMIEKYGKTKDEYVEALTIRHANLLGAKQNFGSEITFTMEMRLLLALSEERMSDEVSALEGYKSVYDHLKRRDLFPDNATKIGLLCRIYRMQKHLKLEEEARESHMWIKSLLEGDASLTAPTERYLDES